MRRRFRLSSSRDNDKFRRNSIKKGRHKHHLQMVQAEGEPDDIAFQMNESSQPIQRIERRWQRELNFLNFSCVFNFVADKRIVQRIALFLTDGKFTNCQLFSDGLLNQEME